MIVKFKKLDENAVMPFHGSKFAAGWDLTALVWKYDIEHKCWCYGTGIAVELPENTFGLLVPRSSIYKTGAYLSNSCGILDSDYRGEIMFKFYGDKPPYKMGDRIGQLIVIPIPEIEFVEVSELSESDRGTGGFGSTGR